MLLPVVCFIAHFLYFTPYPKIYPYFDFAYQYAGSLILPVYYIYFRLLTVDEEFSFKAHSIYLVIPTILATVYCIGAFLTPKIEYRTWLFDEQAFSDSPYVRFLVIMRAILRIQFLIQVIFTIVANHLLIQKYADKAEQFYSNLHDGRSSNAKMLNFSIIIICAVSFIGVAMGRRLLISKDYVIYFIWSISTVIIYFIGYLGFKQKPINPMFEFINNADNQNPLDVLPIRSQKKILSRILVEFDENKIYLNKQLTIMDVVQAVGTNRTYISLVINQQYHQNFCTFVNDHRFEELEHVIKENPDYSNDMLAESCGFGSVISLKRTVSAKTGMSITEWRKKKR